MFSTKNSVSTRAFPASGLAAGPSSRSVPPAEPFQKGPFYSDAKTGVLNYTRAQGPSTLFEVRYGINAQPVENVIPSRGFDPTSLGLPPITRTSGILQFPRFGPSGFAALGTVTNAGAFRSTNTQNVFYSLTKIAGGHTIKGGGEVRFYKINARQVNSPAGNFAFSNATTGENPLVTNASQGNGLASMLLGWGSGGNYGLIQPPASAHRYYGWYLQDDWKITRKLTLNLGFRYDFELPRTERYDRYSWFDFDMPSPLNGKVPGYNLRGGLAFTGPDQRSPFDADYEQRSAAHRLRLRRQRQDHGPRRVRHLLQRLAIHRHRRARRAVRCRHSHPVEPRFEPHPLRHPGQPLARRPHRRAGQGRRRRHLHRPEPGIVRPPQPEPRVPAVGLLRPARLAAALGG